MYKRQGKILRLKGKGLPSIERYGNGDFLIHINVWTPQELSKEQRSFFEQMSDDINFMPNPNKTDKSFFEKVKKFSPHFIISCLSSDSPSEKSYQKNYVDGLKQVIASTKYSKNFQHLFFISSTSVYGENSGQFIDEFSETAPENYRGIILLEAERLMESVDFNYTVIRLSGIYGTGRNYMINLSQDIARWPEFDRWTNRVNEEDAASFILFLLTQCLNNKVPEKLYLLSDKDPVRLYDLLNWIRQQLNLNENSKSNLRPVLGKRLRSLIIPTLQFKYKFPSYKLGYKKLLNEEKDFL